jgi:uncharacterized protein (TIGR02284 family)
MQTDQRVLNRLIVACSDDMHAQTSAASVVSGNGRRDRLNDSARRRETFVDELSELVRAAGGEPARSGTLGESLRGTFRQVRALVIGHNSGDAYAWCHQVGAATAESYEKALAGQLPKNARAVVLRQYEEIAADGDEFKRQRAGGSASA